MMKHAPNLDDKLIITSKTLFNQKKMNPSKAYSPTTRATRKAALRKLTTIVLALDWEITEDLVQQFIDEVRSIQSMFHQNRIVSMILTILLNLGRYIRSKGADTHPDAMELLNSTFICLFRILSEEGLSKSDKKRYCSAEVKKYKKLRSVIHRPDRQNSTKDRTSAPPRDIQYVTRRNGAKKKPAPNSHRKSGASPAGDNGNGRGSIFELMEFSERDPFKDKELKRDHKATSDRANPTIDNAIAEIKQLIQTEFKDLKKEVKRWPLLK